MAKSQAKKQIDVYRDWLGITDPARPLDHYTLLKLKRFEDDTEKIRKSYRQLNAHVRKYGTGDYGPQSQALLNELSRAMLCLTDQQRKAEYDATMGRVKREEGKRPTLEQTLLAAKAITPEQLSKVRDFGNAVGLPIRDAILQQLCPKGVVTPEVVMQAYADSIGLPYIDLTDIPIDESLVPKVPAPTARENLCVPVIVDDGTLLVASPNALVPNVEDDLRLRFEMPVRPVLCTPAAIHALVAKYYSRDAVAARGKLPRPSGTKAARDDESEADGPSGMSPLKRKLIIVWIVFMVLVIVYAAYRMLTA